jgi:phospholipid/cholesterol/gamma-HCH transport system permease protein
LLLTRQRVNQYFDDHFQQTWLYRQLLHAADFHIFIRELLQASLNIRSSSLESFFRELFNQVRYTGTQAFPVISILAVIIGAITIVQAITFLPLLGRENFLGNLLQLAIIREIGPLITGIVVLTRSGTALSAELATRKHNQEIKAIQLMGINPYQYFILPRVLGCVLATFILVIYFDFIAIIGGYAVSTFTVNFPFTTFLESVIKGLEFTDLITSILKSLLCGLIIPLICCFHGLRARADYEIPVFVSKAVVQTLGAVFFINGFLSLLIYL